MDELLFLDQNILCFIITMQMHQVFHHLPPPEMPQDTLYFIFLLFTCSHNRISSAQASTSFWVQLQ